MKVFICFLLPILLSESACIKVCVITDMIKYVSMIICYNRQIVLLKKICHFNPISVFWGDYRDLEQKNIELF